MNETFPGRMVLSKLTRSAHLEHFVSFYLVVESGSAKP